MQHRPLERASSHTEKRKQIVSIIGVEDYTENLENRRRRLVGINAMLEWL